MAAGRRPDDRALSPMPRFARRSRFTMTLPRTPLLVLALMGSSLVASPVAGALASVPAQQPPSGAAPTASVGELELAAALLHRGPEGLELLLARLPGGAGSARGRLLASFAWGVSGERAKAAELGKGLEKAENLDAAELRWLAAALHAAAPNGALGTPPERVRIAEASATREAAPVALAMQLALQAGDARAALAAGQFKRAALALSDLIQADLQAAWPNDAGSLRRWSADLARAQAAQRWNPRGDWPSFEVEVRAGEGLQQVRKRAVDARTGLKLCTGLIERCNGIDKVVRVGQKLRIPTDPVSLVVDLDARWLLFLFGDEVAAAYEVAIGRPGFDTTPGRYEVGKLEEMPMWFPEGREPVPYGDPRNPLGTRWIGWVPLEGGKQGLGFHGTNEPDTVGSAASDGCVRLHNAEVEELYRIVPRGTPILVR